MRLGDPVARYGSEHSGGAGGASREKNERLKADDHDFGGFHEGGDRLAFLQAQLAHRIGGDDGSDPLAADGEGHLSDQAADFDVGDAPDELVAAADVAKIAAPFRDVPVLGGAIQEAVHFFFGNAMVAAGGFHGANFLLIDPLFQRGIADSEDLGGVAWGEEFGSGHMDSPSGGG